MRFGRSATRFAIAFLSLVVILLTGLSFLPPAVLAPLAAMWPAPPLDPTPMPPTLLAPAGELPTGIVGLQEWVRYSGENFQLAGSGFMLQMASGQVIGVTTAHSLTLADPQRPLEKVAFAVTGEAGFVVEFDRLHGQPGRPRTGDDLSVDYVLLAAVASPNAALAPDPRGGPQPGERVILFGGLGDANGRPQAFAGTVQSAATAAIWVLMDDTFEPGMLSGSPLISSHTGQVVGMAIAANPRGGRLLLGFHPIGSLVRLADAADEFPALADYRP